MKKKSHEESSEAASKEECNVQSERTLSQPDEENAMCDAKGWDGSEDRKLREYVLSVAQKYYPHLVKCMQQGDANQAPSDVLGADEETDAKHSPKHNLTLCHAHSAACIHQCEGTQPPSGVRSTDAAIHGGPCSIHSLCLCHLQPSICSHHCEATQMPSNALGDDEPPLRGQSDTL
ncbi:unnamed protein product [Hydatigera taeniaeformis]|uniref:RFXA_RFXANK_bdg domain-containing protein n=1 Tax=Hydatigena taeniaeformis TaxID=6205 RepID=A0A0R3XBV1_HYDTA|nr:unnamed protein product [Hydatigera taeniaeformis]